MTYINRDLEEKIKSASKEYACILIGKWVNPLY